MSGSFASNASTWQSFSTRSPNLNEPVSVLGIRALPYKSNPNQLQTLNIYVPNTDENQALIDTEVTALPSEATTSSSPRWLVYIHGGAWRDPYLTANAVEAAVAHLFVNPHSSAFDAVVSIDYTLSPMPTHPKLPYDPVKNNHSDPSREAHHPEHLGDVYTAFDYLRKLGLSVDSFVLAGHSCGACLMFQSVLRSPENYGLPNSMPSIPRPSALLGVNGLYGFKNLVHCLGPFHDHLDHVYQELLSIAFGEDQDKWAEASPADFDLEELRVRADAGLLPPVVMLDQSVEDQLVPVNQTETLEARLGQVNGLDVVRGHRSVGRHAAPWEQGDILSLAVLDLVEYLGKT